jgi:hypothetical protein
MNQLMCKICVKNLQFQEQSFEDEFTP